MKTKIPDELRDDYIRRLVEKGMSFRDAAFVMGVSASYITESFRKNYMSSNSLALIHSFLSFVRQTNLILRKRPLETREEYYKRKLLSLQQIKNDFQTYIDHRN